MLANGIQEITTTTGTGTVTLTAVTGFTRFSSGFANGQSASYAIKDGANREWGIGTVGAGNTLARTTITARLVAGVYTTSGATAITLASGAAEVICTDHTGVTFPIAKTSGLQGVLDAKAPLASPAFTGRVGVAGSVSGNVLITAPASAGVNTAVYVPLSLRGGIPMIMQSSGSMGAGGALTGLTALNTTYPNCYMYFIAGAVFSGSAAGWYYAVMSSTTTATVYNNVYTSGVAGIPSSPTEVSGPGPGAYVQTTSAQITGYSLTIPGGSLGPNGVLGFSLQSTYPNNANTKTIRAVFGGTVVLVSGQTTSASQSVLREIANQGSQSRQVTHASGSTGSGNSTGAAIRLSVNTSADQTFSTAHQLAVDTDFLVIEYFACEVRYGA